MAASWNDLPGGVQVDIARRARARNVTSLARASRSARAAATAVRLERAARFRADPRLVDIQGGRTLARKIVTTIVAALAAAEIGDASRLRRGGFDVTREGGYVYARKRRWLRPGTYVVTTLRRVPTSTHPSEARVHVDFADFGVEFRWWDDDDGGGQLSVMLGGTLTGPGGTGRVQFDELASMVSVLSELDRRGIRYLVGTEPE